MLSLEEARTRILESIPALSTERLALDAAPGRILAEEIVSPIDLPSFANSAMDGYAVRAGDLVGATRETPVSLELAGQVAAGEIFSSEVQPRTCIRIFTGSALPSGMDAVVMQEDTQSAPNHPGAPPRILFLDGVQRGENIRRTGEDVSKGARLVGAGERLNAGRLALLAATGIARVCVRRQPVVSLLATGSELIEPGHPPQPGSVYESNRTMLVSLVASAGAVSRTFPIVRDSLMETAHALDQAFAESDGVITSGGVSVGDLDFVKKAFEELGGKMEFWRVAIKPGKPFVFGSWRGKILFGLPGNPVSAFVTFLLLVRPALLQWQGSSELELPSHPGLLAEPLANSGERRHFMRVQVDAEGQVRQAGGQASHLLGTLGLANGLVDVPPGAILPAGSTVRVLRWEP